MEERKKHFERPTTLRPPSLFNLVLLAALFGTMAGFIGYVLAHRSNVVGINNQGGNTSLNLNIEQPLTNIARKYQQSIAGIYKSHTNKSLQPDLYDQADYLGSAVAVTSDGWLMSTDQVIKNGKYDVVLGDKVYDITEVQIDDFFGLVFIKIDANNIQPIDFQLTSSLMTGERIFTNIDLPNNTEHLYQSVFIAHDHYIPDQYLFSDSADYYLQISDFDEAINFSGASFFNTKGDVLGVYYQLPSGSVLLPAEYLRQSVRHLLDKTQRVKLGVHYVEASSIMNTDFQGNLIYNPLVRSIELNSLAAKAGLKDKDQILAINNDKISAKRSLTSLLQEYRTGDKIIVKVIRDSVEQDIEIQL